MNRKRSACSDGGASLEWFVVGEEVTVKFLDGVSDRGGKWGE